MTSPTQPTPDSAQADVSSTSRKIPLSARIALGLVFFVTIAWFVRSFGQALLDPHALQQLMVQAGAFGVIAYFFVFTVGILAAIPGLVFVVGGALAFGPVFGAIWGLIGATIATTVHFIVIRWIGGDSAQKIRWAWLQQQFDRIQTHPVRAVFFVRLLLFLSPPANIALAVSGVRVREVLLGTVLGISLPMIGINIGVQYFWQVVQGWI